MEAYHKRVVGVSQRLTEEVNYCLLLTSALLSVHWKRGRCRRTRRRMGFKTKILALHPEDRTTKNPVQSFLQLKIARGQFFCS